MISSLLLPEAEPLTLIRFTVLGKPEQRGSKQASTIPKKGGGIVTKNGRPVLVARDMNPRSKDWMACVRAAASAAYQGNAIRGPVELNVRFYFLRPKCHYRTGKFANVLRDDAPHRHAQTPDLAKLVRCLEDSLKGVCWADDCQVCRYGEIEKYWTDSQARAEVTIRELR